MQSKSLEISVKVINGQLFEFPKKVVFDCQKLVPVGINLVRVFDENSCIVVTKIFLFRQGQDLFGSTDFKTQEEFFQFKSVQCKCCEECCRIKFEGCVILFNGKAVTFGVN